MINKTYYDQKTGLMFPSYKWILESNKQLYPNEHHQAMIYSKDFINHPTIDPLEAYLEKMELLLNNLNKILEHKKLI